MHDTQEPAERHACTLRVPASHPSLPGHFPGRPVVPGVLLLDAVLAAAERWAGLDTGTLALPQVKFLQPLLPEREARIELERAGATRIRFRVLCAGTLVASGELQASP